MKKIKTTNKRVVKINRIGITILIISIFLVSVGYSAFSSNLTFSEIVSNISVTGDVRITNFEVYGTSESNSYSSSATHSDNTIATNIHLNSSSSWVKYRVRVVNVGNVKTGIANILENTLSSDLTYVIEDYTLETAICDDDEPTICTLKAVSDFYITIKYKNGVSISSPQDYIVNLGLDYQPFYAVTYSKSNLCSNCVTEAIGNSSFNVTLTNYNVIEVSMNNTVISTYYYSFNSVTGVLTINNVVGDVFIDNQEYTRIGYIESTGTTDNQYIDTNYMLTANSRIVVDGMVVSGDTALYGVREGTNGTHKFTVQYISANIYRVSYVSSDINVPNAYSLNQRYTFDMSSSGFLINNNILKTFTSSGAAMDDLFIMAVNTGGSATNFGIVRIYSFKIYEGDNLVRDFIPVLDANNVACLYDNINEVYYYNQGSGTFNYIELNNYTFTDNVTSATSANTQTSIREGQNYTTTFTVNSGYELPLALSVTQGGTSLVLGTGFDYNSSTGELIIYNVSGNIVVSEIYIDDIAYMISDGNQYINTNYTPTLNTKVVMTHYPTVTRYTSWVAFFGSRSGSSNSDAFYVSSGSSSSTSVVSAFVGSVHMGGANLTSPHTIGATEVITLSSTEFSITSNGTSIVSITNSTTPTLTSPNKIFIFCRNIGDTSSGGTPNYYASLNLASFQIYENDVLVRNFTPVKDQSDNVFLRETISNTFYFNSGSGSFTAPS